MFFNPCPKVQNQNLFRSICEESFTCTFRLYRRGKNTSRLPCTGGQGPGVTSEVLDTKKRCKCLSQFTCKTMIAVLTVMVAVQIIPVYKGQQKGIGVLSCTCIYTHKLN